MRLLRLEIINYLALRELALEFGSSTEEETYALSLLVGVNGSGKSTVLRLLADLMGRLEANAFIPYPFALEYMLDAPDRQRRVALDNRCENAGAGPLRVEVDGQTATWSRLLLPTRVIAFSSGNEADWSQVAGAGTAGAADFSQERSRFTFVRQAQVPLLVLCGLLEDERNGGGPRLAEVLQAVNVTGLRGFSLRVRLLEGLLTAAQQRSLDELAGYATAVLRTPSGRLLVFDLGRGESAARRLLDAFGGCFALFLLLGGLQRTEANRDGPLLEVNLFLERAGTSPELHLLDWMSDGERSYLARMSLLSLLAVERDALVLLDEPEVHFNDGWKRKLVAQLHRRLAGTRSHAVVTTHSAITLSDAVRDDILVLHREGTSTRRASRPAVPTLAANPGDLMVDVFDTPFAAGEHAVEQVERALGAGGDRESQRARLRALLEELAAGYWYFRVRRRLSELVHHPARQLNKCRTLEQDRGRLVADLPCERAVERSH